jgi:hypothetical protein
MDFDGAGPTALFGETIAFNPWNPDLVVAAGETSGLYYSKDAGVTWTYHSLKGERISTLVFHPYLKDTLLIGTCPASALEALGLPAPNGEAEDRAGRYFRFRWSEDPVGEPTLSREGWGITRLAGEQMCEGWDSALVYATTTHGLYYGYHPHALYQRRAGVPTEELMTAFAELPQRGEKQAIGRSEYAFAPFVLTEGAPRSVYKGLVGYYWQPTWQAIQLNKGVDARTPALADAFLNDGVRSIAFTQDWQAMKGRPRDYVVATRAGLFRTGDGGHSFTQVYFTP